MSYLRSSDFYLWRFFPCIASALSASRAQRAVILILSILSAASLAQAQEIRNVTFGWGNAMRLGRWTPVFVTVEDPQTREIDLQIHGSYGEKGEALWLHQTAVAQPLPVTYELLYPINAQLSRIEVIVSDAKTGKTLGTQRLQNNASFLPAGQVPIRLLATDETLIGISGNVDAALRFQSQLDTAQIPAGVLDPLKLPSNFAGYDGINVLILAAADLSELTGDQEQAILDWVGRGANLLLIPGTAPLPPKSALMDALPCAIGANETVRVDSDPPSSQGVRLNRRELSRRAGAEAVLIGENQTGYLGHYGLGKIEVLPMDFSPLKWNAAGSHAFWQPILATMISVPEINRPSELAVNDADEYIVAGPNAAESVGRGQRESVAIRHVLETFGATGTSPDLNWRSLWLTLAGIFLFVGPVDSIVLIRFGQRPRNAWTLVGWIGLLVSVAGLITGKFISATPTTATFRLVDQVDDSMIGASDIFAVNASFQKLVPLSPDKNEWWEPANQAARSFAADRFVDANCRQDKIGCRPQWVRLNGRESQAWHGETANLGGGLIKGDLTLSRESSGVAHLKGKLSNLSQSSMNDIFVATDAGNFRLTQNLPAGASIDIDATTTNAPQTFNGLPGDVTDVSPERADRNQSLMKQGYAVVACQMPDVQDVNVGQPVDQHFQVLRAALRLR